MFQRGVAFLFQLLNYGSMVCGTILIAYGGHYIWNRMDLGQQLILEASALSIRLQGKAGLDFSTTVYPLTRINISFGIVILILGTLCMVLGIMSFVLPCTERKIFVTGYLGVVGMAIVLHLLCIVAYFGSQSEIRNSLDDFLHSTVGQFKSLAYGNHSSIMGAVVMRRFQCCGIRGADDYINSTHFVTHESLLWNRKYTYTGIRFPLVCCKIIGPQNVHHCPMVFNPQNSYIEVGCASRLSKYVSASIQSIWIYTAITLGFLCIQLPIAFLRFNKRLRGTDEPVVQLPKLVESRSVQDENVAEDKPPAVVQPESPKRGGTNFGSLITSVAPIIGKRLFAKFMK